MQCIVFLNNNTYDIFLPKSAKIKLSFSDVNRYIFIKQKTLFTNVIVKFLILYISESLNLCFLVKYISLLFDFSGKHKY